MDRLCTIFLEPLMQRELMKTRSKHDIGHVLHGLFIESCMQRNLIHIRSKHDIEHSLNEFASDALMQRNMQIHANMTPGSFLWIVY